MKTRTFASPEGSKHGVWIDGALLIAVATRSGVRKIRLQPIAGGVRVMSERPNGSMAVTEIAPLMD